MRRRARRASAVAAAPCSTAEESAWEGGGGSRDDADGEATVLRSTISSRVTCGLCGGSLRDATTISECLHSFCKKCIEKFMDEDINCCCPTCGIDLGSASTEKLSLQHLRSVIFPAKRRKVEEISPLHPALVSLSSSLAHGVDHSCKKTDAYLMGEPMNAETEAEAGERLVTESTASLAKPIASSTRTAVAPGDGPPRPAPAADSGNRQGDAQREHTSLALREGEQTVKELRGAMEGLGVEQCAPISKLAAQSEELQCEHHGMIDKQATTQERNTLIEVDTMVVAVEERKARVAAAEVAAKGSAALPPVASQSEAQEVEVQMIDEANEAVNTARMLGRVGTCIDRSQAIELETTGLREKIDNEREERAAVASYIGQSQVSENARLREDLVKERAEKAAAFKRIRTLEEKLQRVPERIDATMGRSQALLEAQAEIDILREELENERAEKAAAFALEGRLPTEPGLVQKAEVVLRQLVRGYQALELQLSEKTKEHATLQHNSDMLEKEKRDLENQVDHLSRSLAQEKRNFLGVIDEICAKAVEQVGELRTSLLSRLEYSSQELNSVWEREGLKYSSRELSSGWGSWESLKYSSWKSNSGWERTRILEGRLQRESESNARTWGRIDAHIGQGGTEPDNADGGDYGHGGGNGYSDGEDYEDKSSDYGSSFGDYEDYDEPDQAYEAERCYYLNHGHV